MTVTVADGYTTVADLARYLTVDSVTYNDDLAYAINTASRQVDGWCARRFYPDAVATNTTRLYYSMNTQTVAIDDCISIADVKMSTANNGTFDLTIASTDYVTEPTNGTVDGLSGWPISRLRFADTVALSIYGQQRPNIRVNARWGWAAVPEPVRQACTILAAEVFKLREAPFGVAGFADFGAVRIGKMSPQAVAMLRPYRSGTAIMGMA